MEMKDWGLALAGGGGKGAYQAGALRAVWESGLADRIGAVSGASVGALNAAVFAMEDPALLEQIWSGISPADLLNIGADKNTESSGGDGIFSRTGLISLMEKHLDMEKLSSSPLRVFVSASRREGTRYYPEYFALNGRGPEEIRDLLLASSALPVIYSSVKVDGSVYQDGGIRDNLPVRPLHEAGFRKILLIGLSRDTVVNACDYPGTEFLPILPEADLGDFVSGTLDFSGAGAVRRMALGYEDARRMLEWYLSDPQPSFEAFRRQRRESAAAAEKAADGEARRKKLEDSVNEELEKLKELMKKYE